MKRRLACVRTAPRRGRGARVEMRNIARRVSLAEPRLRSFLPGSGAGDAAEGRSVDFHFLDCPLPPVHLPDGTRPFIVDPHMGDDGRGGHLPLDGPADPRAAGLWADCLNARAQRAGLGLQLRTPRFFAEAVIHLDMMRSGSELQGIMQLTYFPREDDRLGAEGFLAAMGLDRLGASEKSSLPASTGSTGSVLLTGLPARPSLLDGFVEGLERLGWTSTDVVLNSQFYAGDGPDKFDALRPRLNSWGRAWHCWIPGWYRDGFDPFLSPPEPPAGEEYRYPVAAYVKRNTTGEDPRIQIDVVHVQEGAFLEFLSAEGPGRAKHYADAAGVEVEAWTGPPADRRLGAR
ncbi:hypothetical protein [Paludisphaera mucosa]|uniref:Uncharacterized protein n=1 Tax=Paludisphaera mucosa TaxID=3030827 RepID=A0ABT6FA13_9BACT|nr:hypothetical protein [Paludisphaera mucosa]MDG3004426.1 hypothetical protein [Paludisphaera mucosa]